MTAGLYADDTHITIASTNVENLVQKAKMELSNISIWMQINKLSANPKKNRIYDNWIIIIIMCRPLSAGWLPWIATSLGLVPF